MPGPQSHRPRRPGTPAANSPSRKVARRLEARQKDYESVPAKESLSGAGMKMHKPGSENRKK